jgi:TonB family protein
VNRRREIVVPKPPEPEFEYSPIPRVDKEPLRPIPKNNDPRSEAASGAMSPHQASVLDAYIASFIKSNWNRPSEASVGDDPPPVSVAIRITKDGRITLRKVTCSSGIGELDRSAVRAIERSGRLPRHLLSYISGRHYDVTIVFRITDEA